MSKFADTGDRVTLAGRVDVHTIVEIRERLLTALSLGDGLLIVELMYVDYVDVAGVGMLVAAQQAALRIGRQIVLRGTPARFARLLRATRLDRMLPNETGLGDSPTLAAA
jgi:anti-anti-sigma factor